MYRDDLVRVQHMLDYSMQAIQFTRGRTRADLESDAILALALARILEIVGEAAAQTSGSFRAKHPEVPWARAVGMRNRLIHAYPDVDLDLLWSTVVEDIPPLLEQLNRIRRGYVAASEE